MRPLCALWMHSAGGSRVVRAVCQRLEASSSARVWYRDSSRDDGDRGGLHGHLVRHDAIISSYEAVWGLIVGAATPLRHPLRVAFMASERQPLPRPRRQRPTCERYKHLDRAGRPSSATLAAAPCPAVRLSHQRLAVPSPRHRIGDEALIRGLSGFAPQWTIVSPSGSRRSSSARSRSSRSPARQRWCIGISAARCSETCPRPRQANALRR